jgi:anti-sigma B factor antagonist
VIGAAKIQKTISIMQLISDTQQDEVRILALRGEIDLHFAPVLRQLLDDKAEYNCPALVLDLSAVSYIDSSGIAVILEGLRDAEKFGGIFCIGGEQTL